MTRTLAIAALALASAALTPVVVGATTGTQSAPAAGETRSVSTPAAPSSLLATTCTRKVKVVYAGYGEGRDSRCTTEEAGR